MPQTLQQLCQSTDTAALSRAFAAYGRSVAQKRVLHSLYTRVTRAWGEGLCVFCLAGWGESCKV